jgi:hypothetical protein
VGPLHGVRVLDFSMVVAGPFCAQILADLGADVVKVEPPRGDTSRLLGPPFRDGITPLFAHFNRNKRSLALDLQREAGSAAARRLARDADVLVHNFRPGVAERLGIGYDAIAAENPRLVYVAVSGFGPDGPYADQPAYDMVIQALSGFMSIQGDGAAPRLVRGLVADKSTGMTAAWGALAALFARERSGGPGQRVDVPMLDAFSAFMLPDVLSDDTFLPPGGTPAPRLDGVYRAWETADGHVVLLVIEDRQFDAICRVLEREDLRTDPRYAGSCSSASPTAPSCSRCSSRSSASGRPPIWSSARGASASRSLPPTTSRASSPTRRSSRTGRSSRPKTVRRAACACCAARCASRRRRVASPAARRGSASTATRSCASAASALRRSPRCARPACSRASSPGAPRAARARRGPGS